MPRTARDFTGQELDGTGLLSYNARYYDPALGKFVSPDTLVPGAAGGAGGAAATLGYDEQAALGPLTVGFQEPGFAAGLGDEHAARLAKGFWFQLGEGDQRQAKVGWGPADPRALNRYAYALNNPVRYADPTGHLPIWLLILAEEEADENGNTWFSRDYRGPAAKAWDWDHILSGHSDSGERYVQSGNKTAWEGRSEDQIKSSAQGAWKDRKLMETQRDPRTGEVRQRYRGVDPQTGETIEFWFNKNKRLVESAYPVREGRSRNSQTSQPQ